MAEEKKGAFFVKKIGEITASRKKKKTPTYPTDRKKISSFMIGGVVFLIVGKKRNLFSAFRSTLQPTHKTVINRGY